MMRAFYEWLAWSLVLLMLGTTLLVIGVTIIEPNAFKIGVALICVLLTSHSWYSMLCSRRTLSEGKN